ncbi:hypothetical protein ABH930_005189 [Kitasatospora sp. GAS204A]|nr:hypothetical protein [Kitasatospora sp. GAS204B]
MTAPGPARARLAACDFPAWCQRVGASDATSSGPGGLLCLGCSWPVAVSFVVLLTEARRGYGGLGPRRGHHGLSESLDEATEFNGDKKGSSPVAVAVVDAIPSAPPGRGRRRSRLKETLVLMPGLALLATAVVVPSPAHAAEAPVALGTDTSYAVLAVQRLPIPVPASSTATWAQPRNFGDGLSAGNRSRSAARSRCSRRSGTGRPDHRLPRRGRPDTHHQPDLSGQYRRNGAGPWRLQGFVLD